jgi:hypothetical protein
VHRLREAVTLTDVKAVAESPTPGELVDRLNQLLISQEKWEAEGQHLKSEIRKAVDRIEEAINYLRDSVKDRPERTTQFNTAEG